MNIYQKPATLSQKSWLNGRDDKIKPLTIVTKTTKKSTKFRESTKAIIFFIAEYFEESNIHGLKYVVKVGLTTIEKCLWLTLLIISLFFCVKIGLQSVDRYYTKSTVVGLERDFRYWNTTMPSVTICPLKRLDRQLFNEYCRKSKLNENEQNDFFNFLEKLANSTFYNFKDIPNYRNIDLIIDRLQIIPNKYMELIYNLTRDSVLKYESDLHDFSDKVRATTGNLIIESRQVLTEFGICYMTNSMLSAKFSSSYMIWGEYAVNEIRGIEGTMQVKVASSFDSDVTFYFLGFNDAPLDGYLHSPYDVMRLDHNLGYTNQALSIVASSMEIITDYGFESGASVEQRKCRFQHENNLTHHPIYSRHICVQECRLNLVYQICKCIPHFYPNRIHKPKPVCNFKVLRECFVENECKSSKVYFLYHCLKFTSPTLFESIVDYFIKLYRVNGNGSKIHYPCYCAQNCIDSIVSKGEKVKMKNTNSLVGGNTIMILMGSLPKRRLKRLIIFSFTDLLVSIGGTAGLFLGFSVLCLVELIYYFTLKLFVVFIKQYFNKN